MNQWEGPSRPEEQDQEPRAEGIQPMACRKWSFGWWATPGRLRGQPGQPHPKAKSLLFHLSALLGVEETKAGYIHDSKYKHTGGFIVERPGSDWRLGRGSLWGGVHLPLSPAAFPLPPLPWGLCWRLPLTARDSGWLTGTNTVFWGRNWKASGVYVWQNPTLHSRKHIFHHEAFSLAHATDNWVAHGLQDGRCLRLLPQTVFP